MRLHDWEARLVGQLTADEPADETRGIAVYRNARRAILRNALAGAYPVCRALVGEDCFDALVQDTLLAQPSRSPNLHHYGDALPAVIARSPLADSVPYLADVAMLEWRVHWAHYAPDAEPDTPDAQALGQLLAQPPTQIRAGLAALAWLVRSPWPVVSIWRAHQPGATIRLGGIALAGSPGGGRGGGAGAARRRARYRCRHRDVPRRLRGVRLAGCGGDPHPGRPARLRPVDKPRHPVPRRAAQAPRAAVRPCPRPIMNTVPLSPLTRIRTTLDRLAGPQSGLCALILLIARAYLFYVFFRSGLTKLHDWPTTVLLFSEEYKVPLLPPALAAALGTFGELVFPSLMLIGIVPRLAAAGLFFVNLVAVGSYWASLSASAVEFHFVWGVLIAIVATVGPGRLTLQTLWQRKRRRAAQGHAY